MAKEVLTLTLDDFIALLAQEFPDFSITGADLGFFDDLGFDSFDAVRLIVWLEGMSGIIIPDLPPPPIFTVADAHIHFCNLRKRAATQAYEFGLDEDRTAPPQSW